MTSIEKETSKLIDLFVSKNKGIKCGCNYKVICDETNNSEKDKKQQKLNITIEFYNHSLFKEDGELNYGPNNNQ